MIRMRTIAACVLLASCAAGEDAATTTPPDAAPDVSVKAEVGADASEVALDDTSTPSDVADAMVDAAPQDDVRSDAASDLVSEVQSDVADDLARDVTADVTPPRDAGPLADSVPTGAVMYFEGSSCPDGWVVFGDGAGRVAAPTTGGAEGGSVRGVPLASGENRTHTHRVSASFSLGAVSYVGVVGSANNGVGAAGDVSVSVTTSAASTGLPYVQLLMCRKTGMAQAHTAAIPTGMMMFFAGARCPAGFSQPAGTQGRLPVGLPAGATNGATFGGEPLGTVTAATHHHAASLAMSTSSYGIALLSGCCGMGYARNGMYTATSATDEVEPAIPTIALLQCQKD